MKRSNKNLINIFVIIILLTSSFLVIKFYDVDKDNTNTQIAVVQNNKPNDNFAEHRRGDGSFENERTVPDKDLEVKETSEKISEDNKTSSGENKESNDKNAESPSEDEITDRENLGQRKNNGGINFNRGSKKENKIIQRDKLQDKTISNNDNKNTSISTSKTILIIILSLLSSTAIIYLFMSSFNKLSIQETFINLDKIIIYILSIIISTGILTYLAMIINNKI